MDQRFENELKKVLSERQVKTGEPMEMHTTFRVGGPADYFVLPETKEELRETVLLCRREEMPYYILGNGSNLLVSDKGYRGVIIQVFKSMNKIRADGNCIHAQAGALLSAIAARALEKSLKGFEFASGIPGTLGGACVMNAGAYGGEMKQVLKQVTVLDSEGNILAIPSEDLEMGYRTSIIAKEGHIVLEAVIELEEGNEEEIRSLMEELKNKRVEKQPLEYPSAGSTFKRPEGYFAGKLIQDSGLRGFSVGGAQVSEKHCGFVINKDHATAADIAELMRRVSQCVEEKFGVALEPEVKRLGEF
jgi:UDP-N-acetylmuramate dehydrogenase